MSTFAGINLSWFPLIPRPRPPGLPLEARIEELTTLAASLDQGTAQKRATRASEILNKAALIASDCGVPALARDLCHRHYTALARSAPLPGWAVKLALQPVLNICRQLIREGDGDGAHDILKALYQAATFSTGARIDGTQIDFAALTATADSRREARTLVWTALLADGSRALAQSGRWQEAADLAATHHGIGTRLLDGRQVTILAHLHNGRVDEASKLVEQSHLIEPWERTVQSILRVLCQCGTASASDMAVATMLGAALGLVRVSDRATVVGRIRIGVTAIDLSGARDDWLTGSLRTALIVTAAEDAYAIRDLLANDRAHQSSITRQRSDLGDLIRGSGLESGMIPDCLCSRLMMAVTCAEATWRSAP